MKRPNIYPNGIALLLYILLSVIFTYPLIFHMSDHVAGVHDVWHYVWNLWWVKKSLLELHASPYHTDYIFHPTGADLGLYEMNLANSLLALPFEDVIFAYNLLCLLSFALGGFGMYLLARHVLRNNEAAFFAGLVYTFAPYHFFELSQGHLNLATIQWIPFYVLYLLKTVEEGRRNYLYSAFFLLLVSLSTWQYALYALVFTFLYAWYIYFNRKGDFYVVLRRLGALAACYLIMVIPFLAPAVVSLLSHQHLSRRSLFTIMYYSSDAIGIFLPNALHPLYGERVMDFFRSFTGGALSMSIVSLGYITMLLAGFYVIRTESLVGWLKERVWSVRLTPASRYVILLMGVLIGMVAYALFGFDVVSWLIWLIVLFFVLILYYLVRERKIGFWFLSTLVFWILSMGPLLQVMGRIYFPLPHILLMLVPLVRAPYRAAVILNLSIALLAGGGVAALTKQHSQKKTLVVLLSALLLFEFLSAPVSLTSVRVSDFYTALRDETGDFAVLDVQISPLSLSDNQTIFSYDMPNYMYYQTVHHKRIVGGTISSLYQELMDFLDNTPVLYELRHPGVPDIVRQNLSAAGNGILSFYKIRYVVFHPSSLSAQDELQPNASGMVNATLMSIFSDSNIVYRDSDIVVFKVQEAKTSLFIQLGSGWQLPLNGSRWMGSRAQLVVVSPAALNASVCFDVFSPQAAMLDAGGRTFALDAVSRQYTLPVAVEAGSNTINFTSPAGCLLDGPCRSFAFTSITLGPCATS